MNAVIEKIFIFTSILLCSFNTYSAVSDINSVAKSSTWLKLLHYNQDSKKSVSKIEKRSFFLAKDGHEDPLLELNTFVEHYNNEELSFKRFKKPIQCIFPARAYWVAKELGLSGPDFSKCIALSLYLEDTSAKSMSYLFVGAYATNPASIMGHSLLLFKKPQRSLLVNNVVSYTAVVDDGINPLEYIVKGIGGGFQGNVKIEPFFNKVIEYSKIENRGIWEYELNLTPEQVMFAAYHIWELKKEPYFNYYFFDENCAYLLVYLVDLLSPNKDVINDLSLIVLPGKIPELLKRKNLVRKVTFHPSYKKKLNDLYADLNPSEKKIFLKYYKKELDVDDINTPKLLTIFMSYLNGETIHTDGKLTKENKVKFDKLTLKRLDFPPTVSEGNISLPPSPEDSHELFYVGIYKGIHSKIDKKKNFYDLTLRPFTHDFTESDVGYIKHSEINFLKTSLRYDDKVYIQRIDIAGMSHIPEKLPLDSIPSFKVKLSLEEDLFRDCVKCLGLNLSGAYGLSSKLFKTNHTVYALAKIEQRFKQFKEEKYHYSLGPEVGAIINFTQKFKTIIHYSALFNKEQNLSFHEVKTEGTLHINSSFSFHLTGSYYHLFSENTLSDKPFLRLRAGINYYL